MATESCTTVSDLALGARFRPARVCGKRRLLSEVNPPTPAISKLGDDLLTEILVRGFPNPRSACRSRAVCKQWRSLISDPCFGRRFLSYHQSMNTHPQLLHSTDKESALLSFIPWPADCASDIEYELTRFAVFDCFKDLLLCGFWEPGDGSEYRFRVVCIYQDVNSMKLDVFSSESGEWTKEALVLQVVDDLRKLLLDEYAYQLVRVLLFSGRSPEQLNSAAMYLSEVDKWWVSTDLKAAHISSVDPVCGAI
ncbi:unnamed protein product [Linum tenue]|uniref:F-box domain-containing protein n=1 Tax=Linum tenue TaxID=586396 RepID=A0AAV0KG87_9ROSI|nr:unnamed protein product [Linum tenue]